MADNLLITMIIIGTLSMASIDTNAAESSTYSQDVQLSPELLDLLREEMRGIAAGMQVITLSLVTADWKTIRETSTKIHDSYIMEKKLTPAQAEELRQALPDQFKQLDAEFHQRAEKLGAAAANHDYELVVFHYSHLVENCVSCHSVYATSRFPGFITTSPQVHGH